MNREALVKPEIYNKLAGFTARDLDAIANFIDFMRHKNRLENKKVLKLEGILSGYDIDFSALKEFKKETWRHVEQELADE